MKKMTVGILLLSFGFYGVSFAATPDEVKEAHFKAMKAIKDKQREARKTENTTARAGEKQAPGFWEKEGERSGLGGSGSRAGQFIKNLNPVPFFKEQSQRYEERKAGTAK
ncbi:MAG: hypothetical protein COT00_00340 [Candidatus Omnitrophica bacterium CG07_land_8_20_14_0_80_50_8]|nr:MAG: hypothetical protein COT00_00340 [Candidatus Omnitrophica bacterium CG07_land_8_20_14_0_80_50_8]